MSRKVDGIKCGEARAPQQLLFCFLQQPPRAADATQEWEKQLKAPQSQSPVQTVRPLHAAIPPRSPPPSMNLLVVLPLLLLAVVQVEQVRAEVKAVKLCGREFLRAVVYTCGGSRWRRFLSGMDMDADGEANWLLLAVLADLIFFISLFKVLFF